MKIVAIAGSQIPSDTANSIQVMKACNALVQLGHDLTLIVPGNRQSSTVNALSESNISRTLAASALVEKGFCRKSTPSSRMP